MLVVVCLVAAVAGCRSASKPVAGAAAVTDTIIPAGPLGDAARRGLALLTATRDSLPANVGNRLRCVSCHLDEGRRPQGTWIGVYARFPQYRSRNAAVASIEDRVNDCFRRSMNGTALPVDGQDMTDIVAYFAFLSRGVAVAPPPPKQPNPFAALTADTAAGAAIYARTCVVCHAVHGEGTAAAPPLWGPQSFNIGAGMARRMTAAAFIRANMPFTAPGTLTDQQALDVAAYITAQPRPDYPGKEYDWPNGGAPPDVPYAMLGRSRPGKH